MSNFFKVLMSEKKESSEEKEPSKLPMIIEIVLVTFLISLIPELMIIGRPPTLAEIYVPILSSILMAIYAYIRVKEIDIEANGK